MINVLDKIRLDEAPGDLLGYTVLGSFDNSNVVIWSFVKITCKYDVGVEFSVLIAPTLTNNIVLIDLTKNPECILSDSEELLELLEDYMNKNPLDELTPYINLKIPLSDRDTVWEDPDKLSKNIYYDPNAFSVLSVSPGTNDRG